MGAVVYPWINYIFLKLSIKPLVLKNELQADADHRLLLTKQELEELRANLVSSRERELIDRAKRDSEISGIDDDDKIESLRKEVEQLRKENDSLTSTLGSQNNRRSKLSEEYELLKSQADMLRVRGDTEEADEMYRTLLKLNEQIHNK